MPGQAEHGWKWIEITENGCELLETSGYGWKWLEIA